MDSEDREVESKADSVPPNSSAAMPVGASAPEASTRPEPRTFDHAVRTFVHDLDSLSDTFPVVVDALSKCLLEQVKKLASFLDAHRTTIDPERNEAKIEVTVEESFELKTLLSGLEKHRRAISIGTRSFVVSLVSHFDAYMGRLIRALFYSQPNLLQLSEKNITFPQLLKMADIEEAREYVVEKEVESVLRESHVSQFEWLEGKLKIPLRKDLPMWSTFVEITERRNLFVHADGVVSLQYLTVCEKHGVKFAKTPKLGEKLAVEKEYFQNAYAALYEVGVKLGHVLWRKVLPGDRRAADSKLHELTYDLLAVEKYSLVIVLLEFALDVIKKAASEETRLTNVVNLCIAYTAAGQEQKCKERLSAVDWTAMADKFKLAFSVLSGAEEDVYRLMRKIGRNGEVEAWCYRKWPLFRTLRESARFGEVFAEVFGQPLTIRPADEKASVEKILRAEEVTDALAGLPAETPKTLDDQYPEATLRDMKPTEQLGHAEQPNQELQTEAKR